MEHQNPVSVGAERVCLQALEDLGFPRILLACGLGLRDVRIAMALVAARTAFYPQVLSGRSL